ncbi:hypothetical protein [Legionella impletisoli]|uniref:Outer membrane protein beta-barrel domain-containing protein n=1 Tax=Legionella impletisoli TaxID=343510 RepID=A0A917JYK3_9GAMM|nr:hypothetical protein [Legionella impletisoli]GGI88364.1 hypothetical protein GCM10007966_16430 [Legionella impletisoli]
MILRLFWLIILLGIHLNGYANVSTINESTLQGKWYLSPSLGASILNVTKEHSLSTGEGWPNDLYTNHKIATAPLVAISGGYSWSTLQTFLPFLMMGLSYTYYAPATVKGTITQYSLPQFENYNYQYKVERQTVFALFKASLFHYRHVMPYLSLGVGQTFNSISRYNESPISSSIVPRLSPFFQNNRNAQLSYILNAGIDFVKNQHTWFGLEYHYGYFGHAQSGFGMNGYSSDYLKTKLTDNALAVSITYFFNGKSTGERTK